MRRFFGVVVMFCTLVLCISVIGCGNDEKEEEKKDDVLIEGVSFDDLQKNMTEVSSYRMDGKMTMEMPGLGAEEGMEGAFDMSFPFWVEYSKKDGEVKMKTVADTGEMLPGMGADSSEIYVIGDKMYMLVDDSWYYTDYEPTGSPSLSDSSGLDPQSIEMMLKYADSVEVVEEKGDTVEFSLTLGRKYVEMVLEEAHKNLEGTDQETMNEEIEIIEKMMKAARITLIVDKESSLLNTFTMTIEADLADFTGDEMPIPEGTTVKIEMTAKFSGYDKDYEIELPEAAKDAQSLPDGFNFDMP